MGLRGQSAIRVSRRDKFPLSFNPRSKLHNQIIQFIECLPISPTEKLKLLPWQKTLIKKMYPKDRRVREAFLSCGRKNGKTTFASSLILAYLLSDAPLSEYAGELVAVGIDKSNMNPVWDCIERMLCLMPKQLAQNNGDINVIRFEKKIENLQTKTVFAICPNSMSVVGKQLLFTVIDEAGQWINSPSKGEKVYEALTTGTAHPRSLTLTVGTQAPDDEHFYSRNLDRVEKLIETDTEDQTVGMIFRAQPKDNPALRETWLKANPSLGSEVLSEDFLKFQYKKMEEMPARKNAFLNFNLNMRLNPNQDEETELFPRERWLACKGEYDEEDFLHERDIIIGIDLAKVSDLNAVVVFAPHSGRTLCYPFVTRKEAIGTYQSTYTLWKDMGVITVMGDVTDYVLIADKIYELCSNLNVRAIAYDPYSAHNFKMAIDEQGYRNLPPLVPIKQNWMSLSEPIKALIHRVLSTPPKFAWNSPVLSAHVMDCKLVNQRNNNVLIDKRKRREDKIDCASALVTAIAYHIKTPPKNVKPSVMLI